MNSRSRIALLALAAAFAATPVRAQRRAEATALSHTHGLSLGVAVSGGGNWSGGSDFQTSAGTELTAAYGITTHLGVFARKTIAYQLSQETFGARYTFLSNASPLRPYVEGAYSYTRIRESEQHEPERGGGLTAALGAEYFLSSRFAMDVALRQTFASTSGGTDLGGTRIEPRGLGSTRVVVGFRFHP